MDSHLSSSGGVVCQHVIKPHRHHHSPNLSSASQALIKEIEGIYTELSRIPSLKPGATTNKLFSKLVGLCIKQYNAETVCDVLEHPHIIQLTKHLRDICSTGEYLLECQWSQQIINEAHTYTGNQEELLKKFVYYDNYQELTKLELHAMLGCGVVPRSVVFVGSGPMPLSSILLADMCSDTSIIRNLDVDKDAIGIASELVSVIGKEKRIENLLCDGMDYTGFGEADVIFLAALVGCDHQQKMKFLKRIFDQCKPGTAVMVRSAHSLRGLLYPVIEPEDLVKCGFLVDIELHPHNQVVNSVILARRT
ncbi:Nicotianamine synthase [Umbelopsis sp. PMI_123]|nr:Nicotianamine synthase [Umbelopsis sp. PMI_123]